MKPLGSLFEREGLPSCGLPAALAAAYGGDFGLARPEFYANFVASVDGVVALPGGCDSGQRVSGGDEPDRFIMGLLRASADAVMIGVGTFRLAAGTFGTRKRPTPRRPNPLLNCDGCWGCVLIRCWSW